MPTTGTALDIGQFVDTVLMGDLQKMICTPGLQYLGFGVVGCGIEFLGACIDAHPFDKEQVSRDRFESAVRALFDPMYHPYADKTSVRPLQAPALRHGAHYEATRSHSIHNAV